MIVMYGALFALGWMTLGWLFYLQNRKPALVDLFWTLCMGGLTLLYYNAGAGSGPVRLFMLATILVWMVRLAYLVGWRIYFRGGDSRYNRFADKTPIFIFLFYMFQGAAAVVLTLSVAIVMEGRIGLFGAMDFLAALLVSAGFLGETLADYQLQTSDSSQVCEKGLWRYSRHPNYFFEFLFWLGQALFCLGVSYGWLGFVSPLALLATLLFLTGIPPAEEQALKKRGEAYREYQSRTSAFIPWWPKR